MYTFSKISTLAIAAAVIATSAFAQDQKDKSAKSKEKAEEIVIRKKGDKTEKMTIVVDGDNVTINGKPADQFKDDDVTVLRRDRPLGMTQNLRRFENNHLSDSENFNESMLRHSNKAMLGILTEKADKGVKVSEVTKESGAEKAGLKKDDIITKVANTNIDSPRDLVAAIAGYKPTDKVEITYLRNGKENKTTAVLGENKSRAYSFNLNNRDYNFNMPEVSIPHIENFDFNFNRKPKIGLQIQDVEEGKGVKVKEVDEDSPALKAGIKEGDVITQLNGKDVAGVDDLRNEIKDLKEGDVVKFNYKRDGKNQTAEIKIPKRLKSADL
jgi:serine protease Do